MLETGETSKKVLINDLIEIPDYIAVQPRYVFRFQLAGCRNITQEDFDGTLGTILFGLGAIFSSATIIFMKLV